MGCLFSCVSERKGNIVQDIQEASHKSSHQESEEPSKVEIPDCEFTIAIFGLNNAGKTCLLRSLCGNFDFDTVPSFGFDQKEFQYQNAKITFYDFGVYKDFYSVWTKYLPEIWGYIYLIDASEPERFQESMDLLSSVSNHKWSSYKPCAIVLNKQDQNNAIKAQNFRNQMNGNCC